MWKTFDNNDLNLVAVPIVRTAVSANPGLNFNPGFFLFFLSTALSRIIFSILFRGRSYQLLGKKNLKLNLLNLVPSWALFPGFSKASKFRSNATDRSKRTTSGGGPTWPENFLSDRSVPFRPQYPHNGKHPWSNDPGNSYWVLRCQLSEYKGKEASASREISSSFIYFWFLFWKQDGDQHESLVRLLWALCTYIKFS